MRKYLLRLVALFILGLSAGQALAGDWGVTRLRGQVLQFLDGDWQPLRRGDIVPDDRVLRTLKTGHVTLVRGGETIELGTDTQIKILDRAGYKPFTTVQQEFGTVSIEADVRNVQHFAVQTPYLAAVVKGTRFTVTSGENGASVSVDRGHVSVDDREHDTTTIIAAGQRATVEVGQAMTVSGRGELPAVVAADNPADKAALSAIAADAAAQALVDALAQGDARAIAKAERDLKKALEDAAKAARDAARDEAKAANDQAKAEQKAAADADKAAKDAQKNDGKGKGKG